MKRKKLLIPSTATSLATMPFISNNETFNSAKAETATPISEPVVNPYDNYVYSQAVTAYTYAYPLLVLERTRQLISYSEGDKKTIQMNRFVPQERLLTAKDRNVVAPNQDTLYSSTYLDLSKGPLVFNTPDTKGRYYSASFVDMWDNIFRTVGKRTTGTKANKFVVVGPNWKEKTPKGVKVIKAPTSTVWLLIRTLVYPGENQNTVYELNKKFTVKTLIGKNPVVSEPRDMFLTMNPVEKLTPTQFINEYNKLIKKYPAPKDENVLQDQFTMLGLNNPNGINKQYEEQINRGFDDALAAITNKFRPKSWTYSPANQGKYGHDYFTRAVITNAGLPGLPKEEARYTVTYGDDIQTQLNGQNKYVLLFEKDELPDVKAFFSITLYKMDYFFADNPINRYSIGDQTNAIKYNHDGSLDIYIQYDAPVGNESNWLPAPEDDFYLMMRLYNGGKSVLDGTYKIPAVKKVN